MIAKRAVGFTAAAMVFFMLAGPLAAAEKTFLWIFPDAAPEAPMRG